MFLASSFLGGTPPDSGEGCGRRFYNPPHSLYRQLLKWHRFSPGDREVDLAFQVRNDALVIDKPIYSCVSESLMRWLEVRGVRTVHLCGIDTDICVTKCAVDLFERGIRPLILSRLCASHAGIAAHRRALTTLKRYLGASQLIS